MSGFKAGCTPAEKPKSRRERLTVCLAWWIDITEESHQRIVVKKRLGLIDNWRNNMRDERGDDPLSSIFYIHGVVDMKRTDSGILAYDRLTFKHSSIR